MINTDNMYYASFLLNEGLIINNVKLIEPRKVQFEFSVTDQEKEKELMYTYQNETATTNIKQYITSLVTIRDIIYRISQNGRWYEIKKENERFERPSEKQGENRNGNKQTKRHH